MKKTILTAVAAAALFAGANTASAAPVTLTWTDTVSDFDGTNIPGIIGESILTTITGDNGGSSLLSQTWTGADFISYRIDCASGWWVESAVIDSLIGLFQTDMAGLVTAAGNWYGGHATSSAFNTSWAGLTTGGRWNNGFNEVFCTNSPFDCVYAANISGNQTGSNWTTSAAVSPVPLPAALPLMIIGPGAMGGLRLRRKRAS